MSQPIPQTVKAGDAVLRLEDPECRFRAVRLVGDLFKREPPRSFARLAPGKPWTLDLDLPAVDRFEYQLQVVGAEDSVALVLDPAAPTASGPFGDKSVWTSPRYAPPVWLESDAAAGTVEPLSLTSRRLRHDVTGLLWTSAGVDGHAPLLVVHDGPEYAQHSALLEYLAAAVAAGDAPPLRAALLAPLRRDDHYGASTRYSSALVEELIPALEPRGTPVGMGASLGALALLHAHRLHPGAFAGLFFQSGSFFQPSSDAWEETHPRFGPITRFVRRVLSAREPAERIPVTMTCGTAEENLANNTALRNALVRQGYDAELALVRDAHNWVAWRDGFHPHLGRLLTRVFA